MRPIVALLFLALAPCTWGQFRSQVQDRALLPIFSYAEPAVDGALERHEIGEFGSCGFFEARGLRWRQTFADGSALEVRCERQQGHFLPGFHVWFADAKGGRLEIARCVFGDGLNEGWFYTIRERDAAAKPLRLERVVWATLDAGRDDGGTHHLTTGHKTGAAEPYADALVWQFDPATRTLEYFSDKFEYRQPGKLVPPGSNGPLDAYIGARVPDLRTSYKKTFAPTLAGVNGL